MTIYITQGRFTEHAVKGMLAKPEDRGPEVQKLVEAAGGKFIAYYMTMGEYDFLLITEGQSEEDILAALVVAGAGGGVSGLKTTQAITTAAGKKVFERASKLAGAFRSAGT